MYPTNPLLIIKFSIISQEKFIPSANEIIIKSKQPLKYLSHPIMCLSLHVSPQKVSNYFDLLTSPVSIAVEGTHKDGPRQKCLPVSVGFRSNDQLIIYQGSSTFPKSRPATTLGIGNVLGFRIIPAALPWWAPDSIFLPDLERGDSPILSAVGHSPWFFETRIYACTTDPIVRVHEPYRRYVLNFFFSFFLILWRKEEELNGN